MSNSIKENRREIIIIAILILCLIGIWRFNIYQVWFYVTPYENFGIPPKQAVEIVNLNPIFDYAGNKFRTIVFIKTENNEIYRCCSWYDTKDWVNQNDYQIENKQKEIKCANQIREKWGISESHNDVINSLSIGWPCEDEIADVYSIFQIEQDGTIRGKTIRENFVMKLFGSPGILVSCTRLISTIVIICLILIMYKKKNAGQHSEPI